MFDGYPTWDGVVFSNAYLAAIQKHSEKNNWIKPGNSGTY
jgi:hypothetical protein